MKLRSGNHTTQQRKGTKKRQAHQGPEDAAACQPARGRPCDLNESGRAASGSRVRRAPGDVTGWNSAQHIGQRHRKHQSVGVSRWCTSGQTHHAVQGVCHGSGRTAVHIIGRHQLDGAPGTAHQRKRLGIDQRCRHRHPHCQSKTRQHPTDEGARLAQGLQAEHGPDYGP